MELETIGQGKPDYGVVGLLHGNEVCGKRAIRRFLKRDPDVHKPTLFAIANQRAHKKDMETEDESVSYLHDDLNRCFPGNESASSHEKCLASKLYRHVRGKFILDLHSTVSTDAPAVIMININDITTKLARDTNVSRVVDLGPVTEDSMIQHLAGGVAVECGRRRSTEAEENALSILTAFLINNGIIAGEATRSDPDFYEAYDTSEKVVDTEDHEFFAENFELVEEGEAYARSGNRTFQAEQDFYPVLMSSDGYKEIFGFKAIKREFPLDKSNRSSEI